MNKVRFWFVCVILFTGQQYAAGSPVTRYEYVDTVDAWLRLHIVPATWQDAGLRCYLEGGILASPTSSAMATAMTSMMKAHKLSTHSVFTGIHDHSSKGEFVSMDGVPLADMSLEWAEGQPDNAANAEHCLALTGAGALADVSCGSVLPYFCRIKAPVFAIENGEMTAYGWVPGTPAHLSGNIKRANIMSAVDLVSVAPDSASEITNMTDEDWTSTTESAYIADYDLISKAQPVSATENADKIVSDLGPHVVKSDRWNINKCATEEGYKWELRTGSCYRFHSTNARSWYRALKACHVEGGHLAIINSETESEVLKELFQKYHDDVIDATNKDYASIGVWKMIDLETQWLTVHGDTLEEAGFEKWKEGEPNNWDLHEHCGGISPDGLLNDLPCGNDYRFPFICEITP